MKGLVLSEIGHIVNALPPIDITGGVTADRFRMKNFKHATIIVQIGVSAAAFTKIIVRECNAATSGTATDIAFALRAEETDAGDTLGAVEAVAAAGKTPSANNNIFYVIEIDAAQLTDGFEWIEVALTNGANSVIGSVVAVLTGQRYQEALTATAIA
jgi:hypothetical protein